MNTEQQKQIDLINIQHRADMVEAFKLDFRNDFPLISISRIRATTILEFMEKYNYMETELMLSTFKTQEIAKKPLY